MPVIYSEGYPFVVCRRSCDSELSNFCRVREVDGIRKISKSSLERDSKFFDEAYLRQLHADRGGGQC